MKFSIKNKHKYIGDPTKIVARSKWELIYMQAIDNSKLVYKWASEPKNLKIQYISPIDKAIHEYWPDFFVQYVNGDIEILEIKPNKEASLKNAKSTYDKLSLIKNVAKWRAADIFAKRIGARFRVITEHELFKKKTTRQPKRTVSTRKSKSTTK